MVPPFECYLIQLSIGFEIEVQQQLLHFLGGQGLDSGTSDLGKCQQEPMGPMGPMGIGEKEIDQTFHAAASWDHT